MNATDVAILGTGMTDMSRRDLAPDTMAYEVAHEALGDAGVSPHELGLVIVGNAMAGRLSDQGCVRGQTWLRKAGLSEVGHHQRRQLVRRRQLGAAPGDAWRPSVQDRPVLALGVEKMWTGDRAETIAGIEDGLPAEYRHDLHDRRHADDNPAGSILMGLNNGWAHRLMAEVGRHRAPDRRRRRQGLRARGAQPAGAVPARASPSTRSSPRPRWPACSPG